MDEKRRQSVRSRGGRQQSIFRSLDDYERHMQDSVGVDEDSCYDGPPPDEYALAGRVDEVETSDDR